VPLFYYLLHIPLIHGLAVIVESMKHGDISWLFTLGSSVPPARPVVELSVNAVM